MSGKHQQCLRMREQESFRNMGRFPCLTLKHTNTHFSGHSNIKQRFFGTFLTPNFLNIFQYLFAWNCEKN